jgi:hypothetical protein
LAATELVSVSRTLESIAIEGLSIEDADIFVTFLSACADSLSLCDDTSLLSGAPPALRSAVSTRVAINRFVRRERITTPLQLLPDATLASLIPRVTAPARTAYGALALGCSDGCWSAAKCLGLEAPLARTLAFEENPRVLKRRTERASTAEEQPDFAFMERWPHEDSDEYSEGELSEPIPSRVPLDLFQVA